MDNHKIAREINYDIDTGVFDNYPKLKYILQKIAHKLFVINTDVTYSDLEILKENDYIKYY